MKDKVNILGTEYKILQPKQEEDPKLKNCAGYCENYAKELVVESFESDERTVKDHEIFRLKVLRHEIIHAFLFESGLDANSNWARDEEMIDFFAIQFSKIQKAFEEAGAI